MTSTSATVPSATRDRPPFVGCPVMKARAGGRVINSVVMIATVVDAGGCREVLGMRVADRAPNRQRVPVRRFTSTIRHACGLLIPWPSSPGELLLFLCHCPTRTAARSLRVYRTVCATKTPARRDVIAYIEGFYNSRRRHSA